MLKGKTKMLFKDDLPLVVALLQTMRLQEVADKWEVNTQAVTHFLKKNGTSTKKIHRGFRFPIIKEAIKNNTPPAVTAKLLNLGRDNFYVVKRNYLNSIKKDKNNEKNRAR